MKTQLFAPETDALTDNIKWETVPAVVEKAQWYPLERIEIGR